MAVALTSGIGLRAWTVAHSAVEHFDEGVYASNIYFGPPDFTYPMQRFYAPPLLPALIEAGMIVGLPANLAALLPNFLSGCGTILAVWWLGRSWFSPRAGIAAATLVALSPFHILFSAAALTDVLLGLWLVLAVDAIGRSLVASTLRVPLSGDGTPTRFAASAPAALKWAVVAGIYTGLAWWTKYSGWLPLAIEVAALVVLWGLVNSGGSGGHSKPRQIRQTIFRPGQGLLCFIVTAAVAALAWSPYLWSLRVHGGYGPIAENHAKHFLGLVGWLDAASRQTANFFAIDGGWSGLALIAAWGIAMLAPKDGDDSAGRDQPRRTIGIALVAAWWLGLFVATPLYWPYPRLLLPWLLATCLAVACSLDGLVLAHGWRLAASALGVLVVAGALVASGLFWTETRASRGDRRSLVRIVNRLQGDLAAIAALPKLPTSPPTRAVYVLGEPALFFQLAAAGEPIVAPAQQVPRSSASLAGQPLPTFLIAGPHSDRDPESREQLSETDGRWKLVHSYEYVPSALVWLDLHEPRKSASKPSEAGHTFRLYELQP